MKLGRVVGTVVSTINHPDFDDRTLLLCDLLDPAGRAAGGYLIAVDSVGAGAGAGAGAGEMVLLLDEGNSARQVLGAAGAPIRTVVVGIVDEVVEGGAASDPRTDDVGASRSSGMAGVVRAPARPRRRR